MQVFRIPLCQLSHPCLPAFLPIFVTPLQGDWGTQFGMLIQYIAEKRPEGLNAASDEDVADLQVSRWGGVVQKGMFI